MADAPAFPLLYLSPADGVWIELADASDIGERIPEIDTDAIGEQARRWVVDAAGRRVRLKVEFGRVDRCEVLPGRPPMAETLRQMRRETVQARIAKLPGGTGSMAWARAGGVIAIITAVIAVLVHGVEVATHPLISWGNALFHGAALAGMGLAALALLYGAYRRSVLILVGLCGLVLSGGLFAPARIWALYEYGKLGFGGNPVGQIFVIGFNLLIPAILVLGAAVTLLANGGLYAQLARLERGPRA
jgi:hypothetical protein